MYRYTIKFSSCIKSAYMHVAHRDYIAIAFCVPWPSINFSYSAYSACTAGILHPAQKGSACGEYSYHMSYLQMKLQHLKLVFSSP